jgi:tetratricopeptide (TPR) repeat protein
LKIINSELSAYENYVIHYIEKIEKLYLASPHGCLVLANAYLLMANLYVELDNLGKAITLYNECLNIAGDPKYNNDVASINISALYNLGIVYYITDQYSNSKQKLENALKIKNDLLNEENSEKTAVIYETLGEIEIEYKNFQSAFSYLHKSIDIRSKLKLHDKKSMMKINILLDYIYQNLEKEHEIRSNRKKSSSHSVSNKLFTKDEREFDDLMTFIKSGNDEKNDCNRSKMKKVFNDLDIEELEKFFLFMTKLSTSQVNVLNNTQPNTEKKFNMPIYFSSDFKNSLNHHQRLEVCNLKVMSLRRNQILKNPMGRIEVENLNYDALHSKTTQNNLSSIKNYFVVNKILKNWEVTKKFAPSEDINRTTRTARQSAPDIKGIVHTFEDDDVYNMNKMTYINENRSRSEIIVEEKLADDYEIMDRTEKLEKNEKDSFNNSMNNTMKASSTNKIINNNTIEQQFQNTIKSYCKENAHNKEMLVDDSMIDYLSKKLDKEELQTIIDNPEFIFEIIEEYNNAVDISIEPSLNDSIVVENNG